MLRTLSKLLFQYTPDQYDYPLTGRAIYVILINLAYISFVFKIGPRLMQNRKPLNLKNVLIVYNALQIFINIYLALRSSTSFVRNNLEIGCLEQLPDNHPERHIEVWLTYVYYLNKFMDYTDTVFFVLRKSYRQVTFLHVYHHILMTTISYFYIRFQGYGGHISVIGMLNTFVHVVMYTYYLLSAILPSLKKNSNGWKRRITELQILQFAIICFHQLWPIFVRVDCRYPKLWCLAGFSQAVFMLYLFGKFYKKAYLDSEISPADNETKKLKNR